MGLSRIARWVGYKGQITHGIRKLRARKLLPGARRGGHFDPSASRRRRRARQRGHLRRD